MRLFIAEGREHTSSLCRALLPGLLKCLVNALEPCLMKEIFEMLVASCNSSVSCQSDRFFLIDILFCLLTCTPSIPRVRWQRWVYENETTRFQAFLVALECVRDVFIYQVADRPLQPNAIVSESASSEVCRLWM